jgi:predicted lipoprotein
MSGTGRKPGSKRRASRRLWGAAAGLAVGTAVLWRYPLFDVVPLSQAQERREAPAFDADKVATTFWDGKLQPAASRAVDASDLLPLLARDPAEARKRYGRTFGISTATLFFFKGSGRVAELSPSELIVTFDGTGSKVALSKGLVFGNTVRDATGLLDVGAYANSQDFNALSEKLNALVEQRVMPLLQKNATVGETIRFVACAELEEGSAPPVLPAIAVRLE